MITFDTKIGDHIFRMNVSSHVRASLLQENFRPIEGIVEADVHITIIEEYGSPFSNYHVDIKHSAEKIIYERTDYRIEWKKAQKAATISFYDDLALKHALMNIYSVIIVNERWGLLIHSSCVMERNDAHLFAGHSGAGKSTAARLSLPRKLLSDEATIVKITDHEMLVYNSPFRSEMNGSEQDLSCHLTSMQLLTQASENKRIPVVKSLALIQLMDKVFFWNPTSEETNTILNLLIKLIRVVPVYELEFQKNNRFWELIS